MKYGEHLENVRMFKLKVTGYNGVVGMCNERGVCGYVGVYVSVCVCVRLFVSAFICVHCLCICVLVCVCLWVMKGGLVTAFPCLLCLCNN